MTSVLLVLGAIVAVVYYIIQMRRSAIAEEEANKQNDREFMRDVFETSDDEYRNSRLHSGDPYDDLEKLASFYERGILTKEEFETKKKELLERI